MPPKIGAIGSQEHDEAIHRKKTPLYTKPNAFVAFDGTSTLFPNGRCAEESKNV